MLNQSKNYTNYPMAFMGIGIILILLTYIDKKDYNKISEKTIVMSHSFQIKNGGKGYDAFYYRDYEGRKKYSISHKFLNRYQYQDIKKMKGGDTIKIEFLSQKDRFGNFSLISLSTNEKVIFDKVTTIKKYKSNSQFFEVIGLFMLIVGFLFSGYIKKMINLFRKK